MEIDDGLTEHRWQAGSRRGQAPDQRAKWRAPSEFRAHTASPAPGTLLEALPWHQWPAECQDRGVSARHIGLLSSSVIWPWISLVLHSSEDKAGMPEKLTCLAHPSWTYGCTARERPRPAANTCDRHCYKQTIRSGKAHPVDVGDLHRGAYDEGGAAVGNGLAAALAQPNGARHLDGVQAKLPVCRPRHWGPARHASFSALPADAA